MHLSISGLFIAGFLSMFSFKGVEVIANSIGGEDEVYSKVGQFYNAALKGFELELLELKTAERAGKNERELIAYFLDVRIAFKQTEFLLSYVDNNYTKQVNGANLQHAEGRYIIEPHGLQVMEDLIYNPTEESRDMLRVEIELLEQLLNDLIDRQEEVSVSRSQEMNAIVWDAMRNEIFRIESMGITGFDVPDSKHSIPETKAALNSLLSVIALYAPIFRKNQQENSLEKGKGLLVGAIRFCENNNEFDTFDRLLFIKNHLHPISNWISQVIKQLNYQFSSPVRPVNPEARNMFDEDFMNPAYFVQNSTVERISLGKQLFFDPIFSSDGLRSCASCHVPEKGFADGLKTNMKLDQSGPLKRNTPTLWNAVWQTHFFYDSRVRSLEQQIVEVIHNPDEMGGKLNSIVLQLAQSDSYREMFNSCYDGQITRGNVTNALACYVQSLTSNSSRFDRFIRGEKNTRLTHEEILGFNLFMGKAKCATCHYPPTFNGLVPPQFIETESEILGIPKDPLVPHVMDDDPGKYNFTHMDLHRYAFKTPSVRNSELTAPYMHNGAFKTLEDVVEFYNNGGGAGQGMEIPGQTLPSDSIKLTKVEVKAIVSFMKSLTDESKR